MEPNQRFEIHGSYKRHGFVKWLSAFQPRNTMTVPIADDETMLARMHHKTRYHIRLAGRSGHALELQPTIPAPIATFHRLYAEPVERNGITLLPIDYFSDLLQAFGD